MQPGGMGIDSGAQPVRHGRVPPEETGESGSIEQMPAQAQGGGEEAAIALKYVKGDGELRPWGGVAEPIVDVRGQEW